jgi:hypothetical protein
LIPSFFPSFFLSLAHLYLPIPPSDCLPEVAVWSPDGSFLIIGDRLGAIHFLDVVSQMLVFSQEIVKFQDNLPKTFVKIVM